MSNLADSFERALIEKELTKIYMVEAGAGAGKTTILVKRMINKILSGTPIDKIVAITFTNKAKFELEERFQSVLESSISKLKEKKELEKALILEGAIKDFNKCFIGTIHSFCLEILRQSPIEAGINLDFMHVEEDEENKLKNELWHRFLKKEYENSFIKLIIDNDININSLRDTYMGLCNKSDINIVLDDEEKENFLYVRAMEFIQEAVKYYNAEKGKFGKIGNDDLIIITRNLLRDNNKAREYFSNKYEYILIDEFQDTDTIQTQILFYLSGENYEETNWRKIKLKSGSFIIVGDPKQSIYRFRNADISIYNEVKKLILASGGEFLVLTTNFRSNAVLCDYFNEKFRGLLASKDSGNNYQAKVSEMKSVREDDENTEQGVFKFVIEDKKELANYIKDKVESTTKIFCDGENRELKYKDYMIIVDRKEEANAYKLELEKLSIPCRVSGDFKFSDIELITIVLSVLRYVKDSREVISLIKILKDIFIISDDELLSLKSELKDNKFENFMELITEKENIKLAINYISLYRELSTCNNALALLDRIVTDIGIINKKLNDNKINEVEILYHMIENLREKTNKIYDLEDLILEIENIMKKKVSEVSKLEVSDENYVRIINIHKAKGLEAPIIFLTKKNSIKNHLPLNHIYRKEDGFAYGKFAIYVKNEFSSTVGLKPHKWDEIVLEEEKYLEAERIRLEYVGATRAKNKLIIVTDGKSEEKSIWSDLIIDDTLKSLNDEITEMESNNEIEINLSNETLSREIVACVKLKGVDKLKNTLGEASYKFKAVTDDEEVCDGVKVNAGGGKEWGNIVHKAFEYIIKKKLYLNSNISNGMSKKIESLILNSDEYRDNEVSKSELIKIIDDFEKNEIIDILINAKKVYSEVKFALELSDELEEKTFIKGIIDLVIKTDRGFIIIDYKSDKVKTLEDAKIRTKAYKNQVLTYKKALEKLTKEEVINTGLYFAYIGKFIESEC